MGEEGREGEAGRKRILGGINHTKNQPLPGLGHG